MSARRHGFGSAAALWSKIIDAAEIGRMIGPSGSRKPRSVRPNSAPSLIGLIHHQMEKLGPARVQTCAIAVL
jgi:hypothetical protein